jgi:hypothetical protein
MGGVGTGVMGVAGSLVGSLVLPYVAASAALWAGQKALFNPYINTRQEAMDLRRNFAGVSFEDATGNSVTGGGLGYLESTHMAQDITRAGIRDMTFSTSQYSNIADMSVRAGLADNVRSKQITQRIKDVAEQIKLVMAISNDPSFKDAIEEISRLNLAGANVTGGQFSTAAQTYRHLGAMASAAGVSVQRLMNTVGSQGQYLFQANGMTPYLGQIAAANTFSGFAAAQRVGLMSPAQLARMGGVEGSTQAALTGTLAMAQTPYNMMALYNQYFGGGGRGSVNGSGMDINSVVARFGANMSGNPLLTIGRMQLYGNQMQGNQIAEQGPQLVQNQVESILARLNVPRNANGKYDVALVMPILQSMGIPQDQAIALVNQLSAQHDAKSVAQQARGLDRFSSEQLRQIISQESLYGGPLGVIRTVKHAGRSVVEGIESAIINPITSAGGFIADKLGLTTDKLLYGSTISQGLQVSDVSTLFNNSEQAKSAFKLLDVGGLTRPLFGGNSNTPRGARKVAEKINGLAKNGDPDAIAYLQAKDDATKRRAFGRLIKNNQGLFGTDAEKILDANNGTIFDQFYSALNAHQTMEYSPNVNVSDKVTEAIQRTASIGGLTEDLNATGAAYDITMKIQKGDITSGDIDSLLRDPKYSALARGVGNRKGAAALEYINNIVKGGAQNGTLSLGSEAFSRGADLDTEIRNGGQGITDKKLREQFLKSLHAGPGGKPDRTALEHIMVENLVGPDGQVLTPGLRNAKDLDIGDVQKAMAPVVQSDMQKRKLYDLLKSGSIDFSSYQSTVAAIDQKETVGKFSDSVDDFGQYVRQLKGSGNDKGNKPGWWDALNPFSSTVASNMGDTTRTSGPKGTNTK